MRSMMAVACLFVLPCVATATSIKCQIDADDDFSPQRIAWDTETRVAEVDLEGSTHRGEVTRIQKREGGQKVNLAFKGVGSEAETEFMVFPAATGYMVVGVGYDLVDGRRYLATSRGPYQAKCN